MSYKSLVVILGKFDRVKLFYYILAFSVILRLIFDFKIGRIDVHSGVLFPYRKITTVPLYSVGILYLEWAVGFFGSCLLFLNKYRTGALFIFVSMLSGLSQMFQHQKLLFCVVTLILTIRPLNGSSIDSDRFLKYQLIIVYVFSAINKMFAGFYNGESLKNLFSLSENFLALQILSIGVILVELALPILLIKRSNIGVLLVCIFHIGLAVIIEDVMPFSVLMIALSSLFIKRNETFGKF